MKLQLASNNEHILIYANDFAAEKIVSTKSKNHSWVELLYRPGHIDDVGGYFSNMNEQDQKRFDFELLECCDDFSVLYPGLMLSMNISPFSLVDERFLLTLRNKIINKSIEPKSLCLEVTEHDLLPKLTEKTVKLIKEIKGFGVRIALDDFGNGFAHWDLLKNELVDVIKVVNNNVNLSEGETLTRENYLNGLLAFAKSQGIQTVLEGIETVSEMKKAIESGYDYIQGYLLN